MRKYSLGIICIFGMMAVQGHAGFKFGAMVGANFSTLLNSVNRSADISSTTYTGSLNAFGSFGYQFGGIIRYDQPEWSIDTDIIYTNRSVGWHGELDNGGNSVRNSLTLDLKQIEVPIIGFYKIPWDTTILRIGLGLYGSYGLGNMKVTDKFSNVPGSVASLSQSESWETFGFQRVNMGGLLVIGTDFKLGTTSTLGVEFRAQTSFTDYADKLNPNLTSNGSKFGIGALDLDVNFVF